MYGGGVQIVAAPSHKLKQRNYWAVAVLLSCVLKEQGHKSLCFLSMPAIFSRYKLDYGMKHTSKKFVDYKPGYGKHGKTSWLLRWQLRNDYTIATGSEALGISAVSFRKYMSLAGSIPPVVAFAAQCIDSKLLPYCKGNTLAEWADYCQYSVTDIAILFNLSLPYVYQCSIYSRPLTLTQRLAFAYIAANPVKLG